MKEKLFSIVLSACTTIVIVTLAWAGLQNRVATVEHVKLDADRFTLDSVNTNRDLKEIRAGVQAANDQLHEIRELLSRRARQ